MNQFTRREVIHCLSGVGATMMLPLQTVRADRTRDHHRKLLFNWDGSMIHCYGRAALGTDAESLNVEQFRTLVFSTLDEQAVDAVLFSFGSGNVAEYQSDVLEWVGEADRFRFPDSKSWHGGIEVDSADQYRNPKALADAGHNPPDVLVRECHQRGMAAFVSLRMNDCHDGQHPRGTTPSPELATFKRQNPDWLVEDLDWWSALNFAHPRVRALKLRVIEEFFDRWDFDGIELDWLRHTLYFPRGTERENAHHLTAFMRAVRASLRQRAEKRGRSVEIAVRVPERLDWCEQGGLEVARWIDEDLVDMLIVGQSLTELPTLGEFQQVSTRRRLPVYPCLTPFGNGYGPSPDEVIRGSAANLWADGADGLCASNWFFYGDWRSQLLHQISRPDHLAGLPRRLVLSHRVIVPAGKTGADYVRFNVQGQDAPLPVQLKPNVSRRFHLGSGVDVAANAVAPRKVELWMGVDFLGEHDLLRLQVNGRSLSVPVSEGRVVLSQLGERLEIPPGNGILGFPEKSSIDETFRGIRIDVPPDFLRSEQNELDVVLAERTRGIRHDLRINRLELDLVF